MRLHGWCETCQRVRLVTVRVVAQTMAVGICAECEDEQRARQRAARA